jgi:hypothetical protein
LGLRFAFDQTKETKPPWLQQQLPQNKRPSKLLPMPRCGMKKVC